MLLTYCFLAKHMEGNIPFVLIGRLEIADGRKET
jgi:hypothetical protein